MQARRFWQALAAVAIMLVLGSPIAQADVTAQDFTDTWSNNNSRKCLEIADSQTFNGARAQQWDCVGGVNTQRWLAHSVGGTLWELRNVNSGKCLEIADSSPANGARAQQWDCVGIATQRWIITYRSGDVGLRLVNENSGKCLEIADSQTFNGARAQQWDCVDGVGTQQWY
jgi:hypothetical protein